jgi:hypothetical protein
MELTWSLSLAPTQPRTSLGEAFFEKKASQHCPTKPAAADYRMRNLLILCAPGEDNPPVTAEVASSSLVVPAIPFRSSPETWGYTTFLRHR